MFCTCKTLTVFPGAKQSKPGRAAPSRGLKVPRTGFCPPNAQKVNLGLPERPKQSILLIRGPSPRTYRVSTVGQVISSSSSLVQLNIIKRGVQARAGGRVLCCWEGGVGVLSTFISEGWGARIKGAESKGVRGRSSSSND